jgi:Tol biopolymer transport system component/predicted Ser/Thr protein kinase
MNCPKCQAANPDTSRFCAECGTQLIPPQGFAVQHTETLEIPKQELIPGSTFAGRYQVIEELGKGGMGRVYKVFDKEISAKIALKLLKPEIAPDKTTLERFRNELKLARDISHKNICRMYDLGREAGLYYLTMEYVPGEDLKNMIRMSHQLGVGTAIIIAEQICDGMAEAHRQGIVHRDLKPSNIMIDREGNVRIMDFGIARSIEAKGMTGAGTVIGTPEYMSPEQVEGKEVDLRSDIYSLGIILYEMLTGRVPFEAETPFAVGMKHKGEIPQDPREINPQVPEGLSRLVLKCLEKTAEGRYQTADEVRLELEKIKKGIPLAERAVPKRRSMTSKEITVKFSLKRLVAPASILIILLAVAAYFLFRRGPEILDVKIDQMQRITHDPGLEIDPAISPDGKMIAYAARSSGQTSLFVRQVAGGRPVALTDSLRGESRWPQWSPDGTQISFQSQDSIYLVPALGGIPKKLVEASPGQTVRCAAWSPDGRRIAYSIDHSIFVSAVGGGEPQKIIETAYPHPFPYSLCWSPDGSKIAYVVGNPGFLFGSPFIGNIAPSSIWIISANGGNPVQVTDDTSLNDSPAWLPDGRHLLYVSNEKGGRDVFLLALETSGGPSAPSVRLTTGLNAQAIGLSAAGDRLAYSAFTHAANIWSIRIPKDGPVSISEAQQVTTGNQTIEGISVSRDGKWLAYDSNLNGNQDIYKMPIGGGEPEQLTSDPSDEFLPAWSPDGKEIAFYYWKKGNRDLTLMMADGSKLQQLTDDPASESYPDWSPDGLRLAFTSEKTGRGELFVISREKKEAKWGTPRQLTSNGADQGARWSPDGGLIAYTNSHGLWTIPAEGGEPRSLVDVGDSAIQPRIRHTAWSKDSRTLYYMAYDVEKRASFWSAPASGGEPKLLVKFDDPARQSSRYEFACDGKRFYFTLAEYESDIWIGELSISKRR